MAVVLYFNLLTILLFAAIWLGIVAYLRIRKKKRFVYLLFFTVFFIYLYKVLDYTVLQFQSLLLLKYFMPDLMLRGEEAGRAINLIPLVTLTLADAKTSLLNILLMVPFGFGLPFITNLRMKGVVIAGVLVSVGIELLQFVTGFAAGITFRVADCNDVLWNTFGVAIGYLVFVAFIRLYRRATRTWKMRTAPMLRYIAERPQVAWQANELY